MWNAAAGNPEEIECSVLFRATPQPRPDRWSLRSETNQRWQGILETTPRTSRRYEQHPRASHQILIQGNLFGFGDGIDVAPLAPSRCRRRFWPRSTVTSAPSPQPPGGAGTACAVHQVRARDLGLWPSWTLGCMVNGGFVRAAVLRERVTTWEVAMTSSSEAESVAARSPDYERARKRVEKKRKFNGDVVAYVVINAFLIGVWAVTGSGTSGRDGFWRRGACSCCSTPGTSTTGSPSLRTTSNAR